MQPGSVLWAAHGACVEVLNGRDHAQAFLHNGFGKQQADLRRSLLRELGVDVVVPPRGALPTYTDLRAYLGLHGDICVAALFGAALSGQRPLRAPRARARLLQKQTAPWRARGRSACARAAAQALCRWKRSASPPPRRPPAHRLRSPPPRRRYGRHPGRSGFRDPALRGWCALVAVFG